MIAAKKFFDLNDVDPSIPRYIVCGATQIADLLGTTQVTNFKGIENFFGNV